MRTTALAAIIGVFAATSAQADDYSLDDLRFLTGDWRGGEGFVFEETWSPPRAGVMTGMARGSTDDALRVLEYIVIAEEADAIVMRFKHFNADYSTWEEEGEMVTLYLTDVKDKDVTFTADPPSLTVSAIRYWMPDGDTLQADISQVENGEPGGLSLTFKRVD